MRKINRIETFFGGSFLFSQDNINEEIEGRIEDNEGMWKVLDKKHPGGVAVCAVKYFIGGRYEFPDVTKEEEPDDGHRYVGQTLLSSPANCNLQTKIRYL